MGTTKARIGSCDCITKSNKWEKGAPQDEPRTKTTRLDRLSLWTPASSSSRTPFWQTPKRRQKRLEATLASHRIPSRTHTGRLSRWSSSCKGRAASRWRKWLPSWQGAWLQRDGKAWVDGPPQPVWMQSSPRWFTCQRVLAMEGSTLHDDDWPGLPSIDPRYKNDE